jgi:hypothetical protein
MPSKLLDEIDGGTLAAEVIMLRAASTKAVILVEGASDEKIFVRFVDEEKCEIVICCGKKNALEALAILEGRNVLGILCIVDSDFSKITGERFESASVLVTDDHDLEVTLFKSRAFDRVLAELSSPTKIERLQAVWVDLREPIWRAAHLLGILRLYSAQCDLNLKFEGISFKFVDRKTISVNVDEMVKVVHNNSRKPVEGGAQIKAFIAEWVARPHDHWQMCCGHDLAVVFGKALNTLMGTQPTATTDGATMERQLRLAYSADQFKRTDLFAGICDWQNRNKPFECLQTL